VASELLTNALKYGAAAGNGREVTVKVSRADGAFSLSVWNSGGAIAEDFDIAKSGKTGLDLVHAIIVEQYRGLFSIAPDRGGTLASITLGSDILREAL
jgi:two-component sensor histidine kinase